MEKEKIVKAVDFRADLHCHTYFSDGSCSPCEVLHLAKAKNLSGLSITDHDTLSAYKDSFFCEAKILGIEILVGIEITSYFAGEEIHILAYGVDLDSLSFQTFLQELQAKREKRIRAVLAHLSRKNILITEEELFFPKEGEKKGRILCLFHVATQIVQKGFARTRKEAFIHYLNEKTLRSLSQGFSPEEVVEEIHKARGWAILAHPHEIKKTTLSKLLFLPFDGLEGYYSLLPLDEKKKWIRLAETKGLFVTGGSDFHGERVKPGIPLSCSWVGEETWRKLSKKRA